MGQFKGSDCVAFCALQFLSGSFEPARHSSYAGWNHGSRLGHRGSDRIKDKRPDCSGRRAGDAISGAVKTSLRKAMSQVNPPMPGKPLEHRVAVYVDGFNLYFGVRGSGLGKYLWLDLCAFSKSLLKERQRLVAVKYFTARIARPESKRKRQNAYLDALSTLDNGLFSVAYGNYQQNPTTCSHCGQSSDVPSEKQTEVNIAVAMLTDAFKDGFDVALLVSAD